MLASKFLASAAAALTIVGTATVVYAQTTTADPAMSAPADTSVQSTAPAPASDPALSAPSAIPADISTAAPAEAEPVAQPDRN